MKNDYKKGGVYIFSNEFGEKEKGLGRIFYQAPEKRVSVSGSFSA